jgi:hypothetical protein
MLAREVKISERRHGVVLQKLKHIHCCMIDDGYRIMFRQCLLHKRRRNFCLYKALRKVQKHEAGRRKEEKGIKDENINT